MSSPNATKINLMFFKKKDIYDTHPFLSYFSLMN